jgi:hypothetical protein
MSEFTLIERSIARALTRFPLIKKIAKYFFSRLSFYINKTSEKIYTQNFTEPVIVDEGSFFGYYDKSPESVSGQILTHSTSQNTQNLPDPNVPIDILLLSPNRKELLRVSTNAYNWQQGARLQWLTDDLFAFNDFDGERYITRVFSAKKLIELERIPLPIQDGWRDKFFLSINYERLNVLRPDYGYRNKPPLNLSELMSLNNDGIWIYDMVACETKLILTLETLASQVKKNEALHKVNHVSICPSGDCFVFVHRYLIKGRRHDRLMLLNIDGTGLEELSNFGMVSHYCWINKSELIGFLRGPDGQDGYWKVDVVNKKFTRCDVCQGLGDGHPSSHKNLIVTDSYPNKSRMQNLVIFDINNLKQKSLGSFFHSFKFTNESRCDLHPRFGKTGNYVYFDSVFDGNRRLYRMSLCQK